MKKSPIKPNNRFAARQDADFSDLELDVDFDEFEEDEPEFGWATAEEESSRAELDDDFDTAEEEVELMMESEDEFDIVAHYFRESACHKLLSPQQERSLTEAVKRGSAARRRMGHSRPLTAATQRKLTETIEQADRAREDLVRSNARLVISIARHYQNLGLPLLDLIQEGNVGLLRAIDRFEPARGLRLSTYATWWVRQAVNRAVANQGRTVRLPAYLQDRLYNMQRVAQDLEQLLGRAPDDEELADSLAVAPEQIRTLRVVSGTVVSLDDPINGEDDESPLAQIEDVSVVPLDELVARRLLHESLELALDELPARYAMILRMRYGIDGNQPRTLEYIARKLDLSRERVRQIERDAFVRLRMQKDIRKHW
jgi:RNA polymerase sigma factor (sigma-70 family)